MEKDKRIRLLKLWEMLCRETDEDHPMGTETLRKRLDEIGMPCDRRTLYDDIRVLNEFGYEVMCNRSTSNEYYVADRAFDIPELRILMDAVQAAGFITPQKTKQFVGKIAQLAGDKKAEVLKSNTVEFHTPKSDNERIYYSVDSIGRAIEEKKQISFLYFDYDIHHKKVYRKGKGRYIVNPLSTVFSGDNYYLLSTDSMHEGIVHYRVDRMDDVQITDEPVPEKEYSLDLSKHKKALFGMFNGDDERVTFCADKSLIDHIFDKFGAGVALSYTDENNVTFSAAVKVSTPFLGWCCSFGTALKVVQPESMAKRVKEYAKSVAEQYELLGNKESI